MVKSLKSNSRQNCNNKGFSKNRTRANKINASTAHDTCTERLSPFGGLLAMIKFLDLIEFKQENNRDKENNRENNRDSNRDRQTMPINYPNPNRTILISDDLQSPIRMQSKMGPSTNR